MTENPNPNPNPCSPMEALTLVLALVLVLVAHSPHPALSSTVHSPSPFPKSPRGPFVPPPKQQKAGHPTPRAAPLHSPPPHAPFRPPPKQVTGHPTPGAAPLHSPPPRAPFLPPPKQMTANHLHFPPPKQLMGNSASHPNPPGTSLYFLPPHPPANCASCHNLRRPGAAAVRPHDKRRLNFGKLMGVAFAAIAVALQVALGAFLVYKRLQLRGAERQGRQWLPASSSTSTSSS